MDGTCADVHGSGFRSDAGFEDRRVVAGGILRGLAAGCRLAPDRTCGIKELINNKEDANACTCRQMQGGPDWVGHDPGLSKYRPVGTCVHVCSSNSIQAVYVLHVPCCCKMEQVMFIGSVNLLVPHLVVVFRFLPIVCLSDDGQALITCRLYSSGVT